ncbi:MAG TPA: CAP domain-containing protein [Steroidobacteraceae bacterium]|nr:CAP domain-containing protein [Steroidobacteraceae bacterium]
MSRRSRTWLSRLALALVPALTAAAVCATAHADALAAVQLLREGGCGGVVPAARPLRLDLLLERAAAAWARGRSLADAVEVVGYRAQSIAGVHVSGPDSALLQLLRRSGCRAVAGRNLRDIGIYARGFDRWIVVGTAYQNPPPMQAPALAARALELVNAVRAAGARCGGHRFEPAPPLALSTTLSNVALAHAEDMARNDYFEHVDLAGETPADRVRAVGYAESLVGENIAYGPDTLDEVVEGWLASPGHCANIMDPRFAQMGIGYAAGRGSRPGLYWDQLFAAPRR